MQVLRKIEANRLDMGPMLKASMTVRKRPRKGLLCPFPSICFCRQTTAHIQSECGSDVRRYLLVFPLSTDLDLAAPLGCQYIGVPSFRLLVFLYQPVLGQ